MSTFSAPTEGLLRQAEQRLTAAERSGSSSELALLLAPDFAGHDLAGRPATRESFIAAFTNPQMHFETLGTAQETFRILGSTGIVCGSSHWDGQVCGRRFAGSGRYLDVWQWRDERWELVAAAVTPCSG